MGEVFLAEDTRLRRRVALKVLPENIAADADRLLRFEREAFAASALNHPNILTIFEFGAEDQTHFLASEFVDGESLRERMSRTTVTVTATLEIAIQIASALQAAHDAGIIHRDIKPDNVMIRADGYVKVLDFGLAKLAASPVVAGAFDSSEEATRRQLQTQAGLIIGTVAYMSPEQARGHEVDKRTDIWSLGCVLYEMLTRQQPFRGETITDALANIIHREPISVLTLRQDANAELERIISRTLSKNKNERYQTATDLLVDLKQLQKRLELEAELERASPASRTVELKTGMRVDQPSPNKTTSEADEAPTARGETTAGSGAETKTVETDGAKSGAPATSISTPASSAEYVISGIKQHKLGVAFAALLLLVVGVGLILFLRARNPEEAIRSVAVLPFENKSADPDAEYLSDGLAESLIYRLTQLPNLKVSPTSSVMRYKGKESDVNAIAAELGVSAVMTGRMAQRGDNLTISVELIDVRNKKLLWGEQYERKMSDLLTTQREIATEIVQKLRLKISGDNDKGLTKHYTENSEAYQLYLKGRFYWNRRTVKDDLKSLEYFNKAVEADPNFALAYVGISDARMMLGIPDAMAGVVSPADTLRPARAAAEKALELDPTLAEAYASRGHVRWKEFDWTGAESDFKRSIELNPNYSYAHLFYSLFLSFNGRTGESFNESRRSLELDPYSIAINSNVALIYYLGRRPDEAIVAGRRAVEFDSGIPLAHQRLGLAYEQKGMLPEAIAEFQAAVSQSNRVQLAVTSLAHAYALSGNKVDARRLLAELEEKSKQEFVSPYLVATVYVTLDEKQRAIELLEEAYTKRSIDVVQAKVDPKLDPLRDDPRFQELMKKIGFPE